MKRSAYLPNSYAVLLISQTPYDLNHKTNCLFVVFVGVISLKVISNKISWHVDIVILPNQTSDVYRPT